MTPSCELSRLGAGSVSCAGAGIERINPRYSRNQLIEGGHAPGWSSFQRHRFGDCRRNGFIKKPIAIMNSRSSEFPADLVGEPVAQQVTQVMTVCATHAQDVAIRQRDHAVTIGTGIDTHDALDADDCRAVDAQKATSIEAAFENRKRFPQQIFAL